MSALTYLAENFNFSWTSAECLLADLVDKVGDLKNGDGCKKVLTASSEATDFSKANISYIMSVESSSVCGKHYILSICCLQVAQEVVKLAFAGKNPKNQAESLNWLSQAIFDFGFKYEYDVSPFKFHPPVM